MAGLDKMKSQILNEARAAADAKTAKANAEAEDILSQAKAECLSPRSQQQKCLIIKTVWYHPLICSAGRRFSAQSRR